ncbi:DUF3375 family protein [Promicromonospora soli]
MGASPRDIASALEAKGGNPALVLLRANTRTWVMPLFAEYLEQVEWVSAEWFRERVQEALDRQARSDQSDGDAVSSKLAEEYCKEWVANQWIDTDIVDGVLRYSLSEHSLRALQFVRELIEGQTTISGARLKSISFAVRQLADLTNPDRKVQKERIKKQITELQQRMKAIDAGARLATVEEMQQQMREITTMIRSLPADFRRLRTMVEDRHQEVARQAMVEALPKGEVVEAYLREHDLLSETSEGRAYKGFTELLNSGGATQLMADIDQILGQGFAREEMTAEQRDNFDSMLATLLDADRSVYASYVRWSGSLRRFLMRAAGADQQRIASLAAQALASGTQWAQTHPGRRKIPVEILGIGSFDVQDISQTELWRERVPNDVVVRVATSQGELPAKDRAALRLAAGTGSRAMGRIINRLLHNQPFVTAAEAFDATPDEFRRLGAAVSLLDLAIEHGQVSDQDVEQVELAGDRPTALLLTLPHLIFDAPIPVKEKK